MLPIVKIPKKHLVDKAVELVDRAEKYLLVTMLLSKSESKIPSKYKIALSKALDRGVKVKRVCFGKSKRD